MFSSGEFTVKKGARPNFFLMAVNEMTLRLYSEALWHLESKECLGKPCYTNSFWRRTAIQVFCNLTKSKLRLS